MSSDNLDNDNKEVKRTGKLTISRKRASVEFGYYKDDYILAFGRHYNQIPIISLTYLVRVFGMRTVVDLFVENFSDKTVQVVILGGGLDTLCFYLLKKHQNVICFDTDLESQVKLKCDLMSDHKIFTDLIPDLKLKDGFYTSTRYKMIPVDVTRIEDFQKLIDSGLSKELPTIFVAECVFLYIDPDLVNNTIKFLSNFCNGPVCCVEWGLVGQGDYYSRTVVGDFLKQGLTISCFERYRNLQENFLRYKELGWEHVYATSATTFWNLLPESERRRAINLQPFDEVEELGVFYGHGLCCVASNNFNHSQVFKKIIEFTSYTNKESELFLKDIDYCLRNKPEGYTKEFFDKFFEGVWNQDC